MGMDLNFFRNWSWKTNSQNARIGNTSEIMMSDAMPRYYDAAISGNTFYAANQSATTWSIGLATTYTGICISNPQGSGVNLLMKKLSFALSVAPAAIAPLYIIGGYIGAGIVAHNTPLVPASTLLGGKIGKALADSACTLAGTPVVIMPIMGGFTAATLPAAGPLIIDLEGSVIIPPGGYIALGALTAVIGFGAFIWDEVPV